MKSQFPVLTKESGAQRPFYWFLPFLEHNSIFERGKSAGKLKEASSHSPTVSVEGACAAVIPTYLCPSDPSVENGRTASKYGGAHVWGASSYAVNYLVFGNPDAATPVLRLQGASTFDRSIPDGLSKTILCAERYASCGRFGDRDGRFTFSNLWADSNQEFRPVFCINYDLKNPKDGYEPCLLFQDAPHPLERMRAAACSNASLRGDERRLRRRKRSGNRRGRG